MANDTDKRFVKIKDHFEEEAKIFDGNFFKIAPHYQEMIDTMALALPFKKNDRLKIIDLGCGTGNITKGILRRFPGSSVMCIDISENMLKLAKTKFAGNKNVEFRQGDIREYDFKNGYDAVVSSLVLHHITKKDKPGFYKKIYKALKKGGLFINADILKSPDSRIQELFIEKWREFAQSNGITDRQFEGLLVRHRDEDRPVSMEEELGIMRKSGFQKVDVILRHYYFALYCGKK